MLLELHERLAVQAPSPHRGSGIGLSVVRLLLKAMDGRVRVAAHPDGGADFQLVLAGGADRGR